MLLLTMKQEKIMNKIRIYISHSIRGKMGNNATDVYTNANNQKAIEFCEQLEIVFSKIDFYCPGRMDEFVLIAFNSGYLTEREILDVDCCIVSRCNFVIAYSPDGFISNGMQVEIDYANKHDIPVLVIRDTCVNSLGTIHRHIEHLMKG